MFTDVFGTITPVKAKLTVTPSAEPRFHRPRLVPYRLKPLVEQELHRLEKIGVLERVDHSEWGLQCQNRTVKFEQSNRQYTVYGELFKNRKLLRDCILSFN